MLVKFIKSHTPYMAGETARFSDPQGRALIAAGLAVEDAAVAPQTLPYPEVIIKPAEAAETAVVPSARQKRR